VTKPEKKPGAGKVPAGTKADSAGALFRPRKSHVSGVEIAGPSRVHPAEDSRRYSDEVGLGFRRKIASTARETQSSGRVPGSGMSPLGATGVIGSLKPPLTGDELA
jgi:hypothetical protein